MTMAHRQCWSFHSAGRIVFGSGSVARLAEFLDPWKPTRVLIVTDRMLVQAGVVDRVAAPLLAAGLDVSRFEGGQPEPSCAIAEAAFSAAKTQRPDVIVAVGGGSNMDVAKVVAAMLTHGGSYRDYFGYGNIPGAILPLVCVPTTAGTGSEVSHAAVLTDTANQMKVSILSHYLRPALAVVDPQLTLTCPTTDGGQRN